MCTMEYCIKTDLKTSFATQRESLASPLLIFNILMYKYREDMVLLEAILDRIHMFTHMQQ